MDKVNFEPDIISNAPRKQLRDCNRRSVSDIQISVPRVQEHSTDSHINYTYSGFHELGYTSSNTGLYEEKTGKSYTCSKRSRRNCNSRDAGVISASVESTIRPSVPTEAGPNRLSHTHNSISHNLLTANLSQSSRPTSSKSSSNCHGYGSENGPPHHSQALEYTVSPHYRTSCRGLSSANTDNRHGRAAASVSLQTQSDECDREIVKDIVRTLRIVGDQLDTKMRNYREPFHYTLLDAVKVNAGQLMLSTVKQFNLVGVALDSSLAFLKLLNQ
ncbi:hypothetical protein BsWGS_10401 [Bradybaena similaris]